MFDLKKLLEGAVAQINPFDNGQDFASVQRAKPKVVAQPASTARPQVNQQLQQRQSPMQVFNPQRQRQPQMPQFDPGSLFNDIRKNVDSFGKSVKPVTDTIDNVGKAVGGFVLPGAAKLTNQTLGIIENTGANVAGETQKLFGDKQGGERTIADVKRHVDQNLLAQGKGLFNQGGVYNSTDALHNADPMQVWQKGGGTAIQAAGETLPFLQPVKGASLGAKVANNAITGAVGGAAGSAGNQYAQNGTVDPIETLKNTAIGAAVGGAIPVAGAVVKPVTTKLVSGARNASARATNYGLKPPTSLSDEELYAMTKVVDANSNPVNPVDISPQEAAMYNQAQQKLGAQPGTPDGHMAVVDALNSHRNFDTQRTQRAEGLNEGIENVNDFAKRHLIPGGTLDAGKPPKRITTSLVSSPQVSSRGLSTNRQGLLEESPQSPVELPRTQSNQGESAQNVPTVVRNQESLDYQKGNNQHPDSRSSSTSNYNIDNLDVKSYVNDLSKAQDGARGKKLIPTSGELRDDFSSQFIDSFSPIERRLRQANKDGAGIKIQDENHITPQIDRAIRADTIAGQYIKDKGLARVIQEVPDTKTFDQYLIAKHAKDLEANGVKTGRDLSKDALLVEKLSPEYESYAQELKKYSDELLDKTVDYGLISKELAAGLKKKYPNYVPANRIFDENEVSTFKGNGSGKASISTQNVVQKIKGSGRDIESPLSSIASKTQDVIQQGERNKAASILASYKDLPGNPFSLRELKASETVGNKPTVSFIDKGKVRRFETTPEIASAAKALNKEQINILLKIMRIPTRALRLGATGINPSFALANVAKDMVSAAINSKAVARTSVLNPGVASKAAKAAFNHRSDEYAELVREGAGGTSFDVARDAPRQTVGKIRGDKNRTSSILYTATHPGEYLRAVEDTIGRSEEFVRALQYYGNKDAALAKKMSSDEATRYAANEARSNSINFARAGDYGAVLNSALPYLNAGVQGARMFNRTVRDRPAQTLSKIAVLGVMPVATVTAWNLADDKRKAAYDDISDYEKQGNLIIVPENPVKDEKTGKWNVIKIPLSQEVANIGNAARGAIEAANGVGGLTAKSILDDFIGTTTSMDTSSARGALNKVIPQALKPGVESLTNQNLFTGNNIVPESQKNLPANEQFGDYTSGTAKALGGLTNSSPRHIDNFIKTSTGGAGQNAVNFSDNLLAKTGAIKPEEVQGKSIPQSIAGRFYGASAKQSSDAIDDKFKKAREELIKTDGYKGLPNDEKAKALNRLQNDIKAIEFNAEENSKYEKKDLSKNQQALKSGERQLTDYLKPSTPAKTAQEKNQKLASSNDAEYKDLQTKFDEKVKNGEYTTAQRIKAEAQLNKAKIGAEYSKETRDYYGLSKDQLYSLVITDKNGKKILEDVLSYGDKLKEAGLNSYNKFRDKNGNISLAKATGGKKSSGKKSGGKKSGGSKKKGSSYDYAGSLKSLNSLGSGNQKALRTLVKGTGKYSRKKIKGSKTA